ncbi:bifunctional hydroxymethylpyrimidine kinase/phosphomethylpyrimidine kinase [Mesorhizobium xinjiangense]|uniref:bifunctional hydroxymethylpyrimidine kinase/phosphomethylpyrimidine kinase n=1 Tax=Mesorhizobium xinjiangense TaxID=2678685 RepID=UPI0012ED75BF|nr:bifunctional hydroxymethylpyrimidine kinase/phosphomethylpyrimidine kinase [Mesorhizobium xinjiangense]
MAMIEDTHVLVVAGSDSSGGAGIARDIETIAAFGLRACLSVTALTVQTHERIERIELAPPDLVTAQMRAALGANRIGAVKIGMLGSGGTVKAVAATLAEHPHIPVVLDPVLAATSGRPLLPERDIVLMRQRLMPLCTLVTPNLPELALLTGSAIPSDRADVEAQARRLLETGCVGVLVKGGHADDAEAADLLVRPGRPAQWFKAPRVASGLRGTGCMLASAIAAGLADGASLEDGVRQAKAHVLQRLREAAA